MEPALRLYLITDRKAAPLGLLRAVEGALKGGCRFIQLREKDLSARELLSLARELRALTNEYGSRLIINDRIDIALLSGADGVHLGVKGIPPSKARKLLGDGKLIGVSTHSIEEAKRAEIEGADFITAGPVYPTPSKLAYGEPIGLDGFKRIKASVHIPVYALGGVKPAHLRELKDAGADGVAMISAIMASPGPEKSTREIIDEF